MSAIDLRGVPAPVRVRAEQLLALIAAGRPLHQLRGKRLNVRHGRVSIPIGRRWRILADEVDGRLMPRAVLSHEAYNRKLWVR